MASNIRGAVTSPDPNSSASSTLELPNVRGLNKNQPLPEEWTLPHEWNIEKREMFDNWKMDVQNQIANLADTLGESLKKHPREDVAEFDYSDTVEFTNVRNSVHQKERLARNTLNYGLARVQVPDRY